LKAKSSIVSRLWGSVKASHPSEFLTAQTKRDGSMRIGLSTAPKPSNTPDQATWRARYKACVDEWNIMDEEQKDAYTEAAKAAGITNYNAFISACLLVPMVTEVVQSDPAKLKATVTQTTLDRVVTGEVSITGPVNPEQSNYQKHRVYATLGHPTDFFHSIFPVDVSLPITSGDSVLPTASCLYGHDPPYFMPITIIKDHITGKGSIATSRAAGKNTFTGEYEATQTDIDIITPASGKKLQIAGIITTASGNAEEIKLDFDTSEQKIWRHYISKFAALCGMDIAFKGDADEPLTLNWTLGGEGDKIFVLVNYREVS